MLVMKTLQEEYEKLEYEIKSQEYKVKLQPIIEIDLLQTSHLFIHEEYNEEIDTWCDFEDDVYGKLENNYKKIVK